MVKAKQDDDDRRTTVSLSRKLHRLVKGEAFLRSSMGEEEVTVQQVVDEIVRAHYERQHELAHQAPAGE